MSDLECIFVTASCGFVSIVLWVSTNLLFFFLTIFKWINCRHHHQMEQSSSSNEFVTTFKGICVDLSEEASGLVRKYLWVFQKLQMDCSEAKSGCVKMCRSPVLCKFVKNPWLIWYDMIIKWICRILHVNFPKAAYGLV